MLSPDFYLTDLGDGFMVLDAKRLRLRSLLPSTILTAGLLALTACEPPNKHPEPINGPYLETLSGAWTPRNEKEPCKTEKVPLLVGSFQYDMSEFCSVAVVPF